MAITRRDLIRSGITLAAAASLPAFLRPARADGPGGVRHLLVVLNFGGWDTTYSIDPKPGMPNVDVGPGTLRSFGDIPIWSDPSRPSVDRFFERWGDLTAIVNGVQVRSFVHQDCIKRVLSGGPSDGAPDFGAIAAYELGRDLPVPYLALGNQARSGPLAAITGRAGTTNQLTALVDPEAAYFAPGGLRPDPGLVTSDGEKSLVNAFLTASAERLRATRGARGYNQKRIDDFVQSLSRADRLGEFVRSGASLGERAYTVDLEVQIPLAMRAFSEGLSRTALIQSGYTWDTHQDNRPQAMYHEGLFGSLDRLCDALVESGRMDDTMVVVMSEMGRTPKLNDTMGKDHWPVTSCMFVGAGVAGGRVLGGTTDELGAQSLNLETGAVDANGKQLQTSNLVAGILEAVGVDPAPYLPDVEAFRAFRSA